jgi:cell division protein FtsB
MPKERKKQFSLSLILRVFLVLIVVVSIIVFANSVMRYNALLEEQKELETLLTGLNENIEELNELLGSGDAVQQLLNDYEAYEALLNSDSEAGGALEELEERREKLREMIQSSKNKEYIVRIAKERLGLYFPDEEIFYNDMN